MNLAARTVDYVPLNRPITACVLTERYDNVSYGFSFFTGDLWPARFALRVKIEGRRGGKTRRHFRQSDVARVILGCGIRGDHYF